MTEESKIAANLQELREQFNKELAKAAELGLIVHVSPTHNAAFFNAVEIKVHVWKKVE